MTASHSADIVRRKLDALLREESDRRPRGTVTYTMSRCLAEGNTILTHGIYEGLNDHPQVAFDLWWLGDGDVIEHVRTMGPLVSSSRSGRSQTDGPVTPVYADDAYDNREVLRRFFEVVLVGRDYTKVAKFISVDSYAQHNPEADDGLVGFKQAVGRWAAEGRTLDYRELLNILVDGDFVFTRASGAFGEPVTYNELWRLENGVIVEHWDIIEPVGR